MNYVANPFVTVRQLSFVEPSSKEDAESRISAAEEVIDRIGRQLDNPRFYERKTREEYENWRARALKFRGRQKVEKARLERWLEANTQRRALSDVQAVNLFRKQHSSPSVNDADALIIAAYDLFTFMQPLPNEPDYDPNEEFYSDKEKDLIQTLREYIRVRSRNATSA